MANNRNRNRGILFGNSPYLKVLKKRTKATSVSCSSSTTFSSLIKQFHTCCSGFLRFKWWVRASVLFKKKEARLRHRRRHDYCSNHIDFSKSQVVEDNGRNEDEHSSSTNCNSFRLSSVDKKKKKKLVEFSHEPFLPLNEEDVAEVNSAFSPKNRMKILVSHKNSGIEISGNILRCLMPTQWLNDDVVNLYLVLLKERELRDPQKYFKCHFFSTFFYFKLVSQSGYNYESVRRWTTQRKLGYDLIDCDMIFVPIHINDIHWTLAVINNRERKFMYVDSLNKVDRTVLNALRKYLVDEVRDKSGKNIDISSWEMEYIKELPLQQNGYDCGMFMLKYIDFYSRGLNLLQFSQKNMQYFRSRTAMEILRLRAD